MREILFRGKRTDNGEWVEGFLVKHPSAVRIGDYSPWYISVPPEDPEANGGLYNISPETVGQYTGLTDKNGKKIFEGDVIRYLDGDFRPKAVVKVDVSRSYWVGFYLDWETSHPCLRQNLAFWTNEREIEVIGNIHDNPELLEGSAEDAN